LALNRPMLEAPMAAIAMRILNIVARSLEPE
jgi:hypothetical protein